MTRYGSVLLVCLTTAFAATAGAQTRLTLADAVARAKTQNLDMRAAQMAEREALHQQVQARAGYYPRVDLTEAWQRGNQPVFVFSSLLAQRRFTAEDFALNALNRPGPLNNFRAGLTVEQSLFDPAVGPAVRSAGIARESAAATRTLVEQDLAVAATEAYGRVLVAIASKQAAASAVEAARADREVAGHRRDAGLATDADVLQLDVHLARMHEQQIRAEADERISRDRLNEVMGERLDTVFVLDALPETAPPTPTDLPRLEEESLQHRADVKLMALQEQLAGAEHKAARAAFLPQVAAQAGWEANGVDWSTRASSWTIAVVARVNLFHGFADRARVAAAAEQQARRGVEREKAETAARLDVRAALARLEAARASEAAGRAAAAQSRESRRIVRDRYESGLADVASLLRAAEAVQQAESREIAARVEVVVAAAALERALGK